MEKKKYDEASDASIFWQYSKKTFTRLNFLKFNLVVVLESKSLQQSVCEQAKL